MAKLLDIVKPGVVTGEDVQKSLLMPKANNFAIPAVNCVGSDSVNAVLETAARVKAPVIINSQTVVQHSTQVKVSNQQAVLVRRFRCDRRCETRSYFSQRIRCASYSSYRPRSEKITSMDRWLT